MVASGDKKKELVKVARKVSGEGQKGGKPQPPVAVKKEKESAVKDVPRSMPARNDDDATKFLTKDDKEGVKKGLEEIEEETKRRQREYIHMRDDDAKNIFPKKKPKHLKRKLEKLSQVKGKEQDELKEEIARGAEDLESYKKTSAIKFKNYCRKHVSQMLGEDEEWNETLFNTLVEKGVRRELFLEALITNKGFTDGSFLTFPKVSKKTKTSRGERVKDQSINKAEEESESESESESD